MSIIRAMVVAAFLACPVMTGAAAADGAEPTTANEVLDRAIAAADAGPKAYAVHVENEIEFLERPAASRAPDDVTKELYSYDLRIDGERVDLADTRRELRAGDAQPTPAFCMRTIWDGKREIHRQRYLGGDGKSEVEPSVG